MIDPFELIHEWLLENRPEWIVQRADKYGYQRTSLVVRRSKSHKRVSICYNNKMEDMPLDLNLVSVWVEGPTAVHFAILDLRDPRFFEEFEEKIVRNSVKWGQEPEMVTSARALMFP